MHDYANKVKVSTRQVGIQWIVCKTILQEKYLRDIRRLSSIAAMFFVKGLVINVNACQFKLANGFFKTKKKLV